MDGEMCPSDKLLPEMWMEIFSKLSAKTLVQLRSVSKTWCSIIDNPTFVSMHIAGFKNNSNKHFLISFETQSTLGLNEYELKIRVRTMGKFRKREEILWMTFSSENYNLDYKGYVDGLVLLGRFQSGNYDLFLFNPSIRKSIVLPEVPPSPGGRAEIIIGFDPVIKDYKVAMIVFPFRLPGPGDTTPAAILVYQLGTGVWRVNSDVEAPEGWYLGEKVLTKGVMHWISFDREVRPLRKNNTHIVSFNFSSETFSFTELPGDRSDDNEKITCPFLLGDSLAVIDVFLDPLDVSRANFYIWVMNMNKCVGIETEPWSKWYHRSLGLDTFGVLREHKYHIKNVIYVESMYKFMLVVNGKMKSFDLKNGRMNDLVSSHCRYSMDPYVESLLLCKGSQDRVSSATQTEEVNGEG